MFRFQDPYFLLLLIPLAVLSVWLCFRRKPDAIIYSDIRLLKGVPRSFAQRLKRIIPVLKFSLLVLAILALARPQAGTERFRVETEGIAIVLCVDRSGSMRAIDFKLDGVAVDRLTAVKKTSRDFILGKKGLRGRPNDLIGLVVFGGYVDAECPLTLAHDMLIEMLDQVEPVTPILDSYGTILNQELYREENLTAIGDALLESVNRLKDVEAESKVIIFLSDGEQTAFRSVADPKTGTMAAKAYGIKVYTIGIGTTGNAPFKARDQFGREGYVNTFVRLDEETLKMIASETGGRYYNAQSTDSLDAVYKDIDLLEKTVFEDLSYTRYVDWYRFFLGPAVLLFILVLVLENSRFRSIPF